jgi:hypothetical protein
MQAWINFQLKLVMKIKKTSRYLYFIHQVSDIHIIGFNDIYYPILNKAIVQKKLIHSC